MARLIKSIANNVHIALSTVHVRYEEPLSHPGEVAALGFTLGSASVPLTPDALTPLTSSCPHAVIPARPQACPSTCRPPTSC